MGLVTITPASGTVVSVGDLKAHARIDSTTEDTLLASYIAYGELYAARLRGEQFLTATYRRDVVGPAVADDRLRRIYGLADDVESFIRLELPPLQSVTSIHYYDSSNGLQTLSPSLYRVISSEKPALIVFDKNFPTLYTREDALQVTFVAGYGISTAVPANIRQAILLLAADAYRHRELSLPNNEQQVHITADRLLTLDRCL